MKNKVSLWSIYFACPFEMDSVRYRPFESLRQWVVFGLPRQISLEYTSKYDDAHNEPKTKCPH